MRQKSGPLFVQPFFDVNKGLLHCTSVRSPLLFSRKPFPLLFWHFITTWMAPHDFTTKISSSCRNSIFTNVYLSSRQLRDTTYPNINYVLYRHARSLPLLEQMLFPTRGLKSFQIPLCPFSYSQHAICFCKVQENSLLARHMRNEVDGLEAAYSDRFCFYLWEEPILLVLLVYSNTTGTNI